jgi:hypothetical protein
VETSLQSREIEFHNSQQELQVCKQQIETKQSESQKHLDEIKVNLSSEVEQHAALKVQYEEAMSQVSRLERASTMDVGQFEELEASKLSLESQVGVFKTGIC